MKKYLVIVRDVETGTSGVHDFDDLEEAQAFHDKAKEGFKQIVSDEEEMIEMMKKSSDIVLRHTLGNALAHYNVPKKKGKEKVIIPETIPAVSIIPTPAIPKKKRSKKKVKARK